MTTRIATAFLIGFIICSSLFNSGYFGNVSLDAYFGFCISSIIVSIILSFGVSNNSRHIPLDGSFRVPGPLHIFLALTAYITIHGCLSHHFNLSHYYWLAAGALLLTIKGAASAGHLRYLPAGIMLIALFESFVVLFQWLGLSPSMNELFVCTGTWANPNVTAMFLAMSLFSQKQPLNRRYGKTFFLIQLSLILLAIVVLHCRTAYVVAALFLLESYKHLIPAAKLPLVRIAAIVLFVVCLAFGAKRNSTDGRIQVWRNTLQLIYSNPITGIGFGQFEKEYNAFVAAHNLPSTDHVYMPYNDFLELAVEGGGIAVVLWTTFLVLLIRRCKNDSKALAMVISFIVIQLTNFGFQAIPVYALFLIYTGSYLYDAEKIKDSSKIPGAWLVFKPMVAITIVVELLICTRLFLIANAFHQTKMIREEYPAREAIERYGEVANTLGFSSSYHESSGDLFMRTGNYIAAKSQYMLALQTTSRPDVLGKCGWCCGRLGQYDSAIRCFEVIEKLQPFKYAPRMALLKLYEQKKDTASIKSKAREIMAMPVKVPGAEVDRMKGEARKWMQVN